MRLLALPLLCGLALPAVGQTTFTVIGQGAAYDANSDATAVCGADSQGAWLWTQAGGYVPLGEQSAEAVSEDGTVVLGQIKDGSGSNVAGLWTQATGWQSLGGLSSGCGSDVSNPYDLSGDGLTAVGLGWQNCTGVPFRWTSTGGMDEIAYSGLGSGRASAVSDDGLWVGGWDEASNGSRRACIWDTNDSQTFLLVSGANPDGAGEVIGLSDDGTWAVGTEFKDAYIWSAATGVNNIGDPGGGGILDVSLLMDITNDGQIAVGGFGGGPFIDATIWTPATGLIFLRDFLIARGIDMSAWEPALATSISPDGSRIVGYARAAGTFDLSWFIIEINTGPLGTNYCGPGNLNSTGQSGVISAFGSPVAADNLLDLTGSQLPPGQFAYFLNSQTQGFVTNPGGSQGNLCLGGGIGRHVSQIGSIDSGGEFSISLDLTSVPTPSGPTAVLSGSTWNWQCWHRDKNPTTTSNFTDGIEITFQ